MVNLDIWYGWIIEVKQWSIRRKTHISGDEVDPKQTCWRQGRDDKTPPSGNKLQQKDIFGPYSKFGYTDC